MALARVKTWVAAEVLSASDLNAEFNNILNNATSLISPATGTWDLNANVLVLDADADTSITSDTDDRVDFALGGTDVFRFNTVASAVNGIDFAAAATGNAPSFTAFGSDTNVSIIIAGKGTGAVHLGQATSTDVRLLADQPIADSSGNELIKFSKTASAINELTVTNAATGNAPSLSVTGGDTNINLNLVPKGTGVAQVGGSTLPVVLNRDVTQVEVVNTTTETTVYSFSVPANTLGSDRALRLTLFGDYLNNTGVSTHSLSVKAKLGATQLGFFVEQIPTNASRRFFRMIVEIDAAGATNSQVASVESHLTAADVIDGTTSHDTNDAAYFHRLSAHLSAAEDSTAALTLAVTAQHTAASANLSFRLYTAQLELI